MKKINFNILIKKKSQKTGFPHAEYTYAEALRDKGLHEFC